jgi:anti-sigma regulatory factor (Ser/Thr protein kinase)
MWMGREVAELSSLDVGCMAMTGDGTYPVLDQRFDGNSLYQLRAVVAVHASNAGLPRQRADDMVMTVHELAVNSVRHGPGYGRLRIWKHHQTVICQVSDDGGTSEPGDWPVQPGHGLWLVRQLADHLIVRSGADGVSATVSFAAGRSSGWPDPPGPGARSSPSPGSSTSARVAGSPAWCNCWPTRTPACAWSLT